MNEQSRLRETHQSAMESSREDLMKKFNEQLDCFGRNNILWAAMDEGLEMDEMDGCAPQELCAQSSKDNDWGLYDRLPVDKQNGWNRKAAARNKKSLAFWVNYFKPISVHLDKSPDVLSTVLRKIFPKQIVPEPDLEDQVYGNALMSQMAQFPHYDEKLSRSLLRIVMEPTWYDEGGFRLRSCAQRLFAHAPPSQVFMKIWTRILVGHPEVEGPWDSDKLLASVACIGETISLYHSPSFGRQLWDAYSVMLASPHVAAEVKGLILSQTRYSFVGFRIVLQRLFAVAQDILPSRRGVTELGLEELDMAMLYLVLAEERKMRWTVEEEAWLKKVLPALEFAWQPRLAHVKTSVASSRDVISSIDIFCAWCLKKSTTAKSCSRCKGPSYCDTTCQRDAWKAHHKHVCTDNINRFRE
ncbi:hypothetical protein DFH07DRAFT_795735 [Mycena maculata]|uniref:MYND-type domain-containing protein n=1 Tax=Mycena maculata TaxID=230809 RepID=A0AAD7K7K9_9AGAR|nr:hypothetical protein DFH07DRAFT_795735 [Mycena maculata]